ncbi:hypothetical protein HRbin24_00379 [bacterium HR24]|nr:hypothetical protein HRbin24_00379 [bacterium HR24]
MEWEWVVGGIISIALALYLVYALIDADRL